MTGDDQGDRSLQFTPEFMQLLISKDCTENDRRHILRALDLLDANERHPSLRVHRRHGDMEGLWWASASDELRISFTRLGGGRKRLVACTRHYSTVTGSPRPGRLDPTPRVGEAPATPRIGAWSGRFDCTTREQCR